MVWFGTVPLPTMVISEPALRADRPARLPLRERRLVGVTALRVHPPPGLGAVVLAESLALSPVPWPAVTTPVPGGPVLKALAAAEPGGVLSVPVEREDLGDLSWMLLAQTRHGKPVQDGGIHRRAGAEATSLFTDNPLLLSLATQGPVDWPTGRAATYYLDALYREGYRYALAPADQDEAIRGSPSWWARPPTPTRRG